MKKLLTASIAILITAGLFCTLTAAKVKTIDGKYDAPARRQEINQ